MLHSALQLLDRSAQELGVDEGAIEVFAAACVFVAAKVELEPAAVPSLESVLAKLRSTPHGRVAAQTFQRLELGLLGILEWSAVSATCAHFLPSYARRLPDSGPLCGREGHSFLDHALLVVAEERGRGGLSHPPSQVSATILYLTLAETMPSARAAEAVEQVTGYGLDRDLGGCLEELERATTAWQRIRSKLPKGVSPRSTLNAPEDAGSPGSSVHPLGGTTS